MGRSIKGSKKYSWLNTHRRGLEARPYRPSFPIVPLHHNADNVSVHDRREVEGHQLREKDQDPEHRKTQNWAPRFGLPIHIRTTTIIHSGLERQLGLAVVGGLGFFRSTLMTLYLTPVRVTT